MLCDVANGVGTSHLEVLDIETSQLVIRLGREDTLVPKLLECEMKAAQTREKIDELQATQRTTSLSGGRGAKRIA
jgi:hypothetical protein